MVPNRCAEEAPPLPECYLMESGISRINYSKLSAAGPVIMHLTISKTAACGADLGH